MRPRRASLFKIGPNALSPRMAINVGVIRIPFIFMVAACYGALYAIVSTVNVFRLLRDRSAQIDGQSRLVSTINITVCAWAYVSLWDDMTESFWNLSATAFESNAPRDFYIQLLAGKGHLRLSFLSPLAP